jgi:acetyltransferase
MSRVEPSFAGTDPREVLATLQDGRQVLLRPVRAGDDGLVQAFVRALSPQSRYNRFFSGLAELPGWMLQRLTRPVYRKEFGLVAVAGCRDTSAIVGMAHYALEDSGRAELSVAVADAWQRQGLGTRLVQALARHADRAGFETLGAVMLADNRPMLALAKRLGCPVVGNPEPGLVRIEKLLARPSAAGLPAPFIPAWSYA